MKYKVHELNTMKETSQQGTVLLDQLDDVRMMKKLHKARRIQVRGCLELNPRMRYRRLQTALGVESQYAVIQPFSPGVKTEHVELEPTMGCPSITTC